MLTRSMAALPPPPALGVQYPGRGRTACGAPAWTVRSPTPRPSSRSWSRRRSAARTSKPDQFYRLQNYEARSEENRRHAAHAWRGCMTGAWYDKTKGLLSLITPRWAARPTSARCCSPASRWSSVESDGTPTKSAWRDRRAGRRRPRQRRACSRSAKPSARPAAKCSDLRRLQRKSPTATRSRKSRPRPTW